MICTLAHLQHTQIWKLGAPTQDKHGTIPLDTFVSLDGSRTPLDPACLRLVSLGRKRVQDSFEEYYVRSKNQVGRTNEASGRFARVPTRAVDTIGRLKRKWAKDYSTDVDYLCSKESKDGPRLCLTKAAALQHLRALATQYGSQPWASSLKDEKGIEELQAKKARVVIEELCRARVLVRDVGKAPFPPEPQNCEEGWTAEAAEQELSQQLYMLACDGSSDSEDSVSDADL